MIVVIHMGSPIFRIKNISKGFGKHLILNDISLDIKSGEIIGLIGANGSGKTTFLNTMVGFLKPEEGSVEFQLGQLLSTSDSKTYRSVLKRPHLVKQVYGFATQVPSFYEELTTIENLKFFGNLHNFNSDAIRSNIKILLELMELKETRNVKAKKLSSGMERRLDIACALMHDPKVLILDEPTADLDPLLRQHIWELIKKINQKGTTIILSSHHLNELESLCDRVGFLQDGELAALGNPESLKKDLITEQKIIFQTHERKYKDIVKSLNHKEIIRTEISDNTLIIYTKDPSAVLEHCLKTVRKEKDEIEFIDIKNASLDDVFLELDKDSEKKTGQRGGSR